MGSSLGIEFENRAAAIGSAGTRAAAAHTTNLQEPAKSSDGGALSQCKAVLDAGQSHYNSELEPIVLTGTDEGEIAVVAELVDLVETGAAALTEGTDTQ